MEKQRNRVLIGIILFSILFITNIVLFVTKVFKWWLFVIFFVATAILILINVLLFVKFVRKIKKIKNDQKNNQSSGDYTVDIYEILGIPVQYNKDGSVKSIYDLLGIEPVYDEKGNRILTIYELLEIMPKFKNNGEEIPSVVAIKNRVKRVAKVDISSRVLTRKLTEEEMQYAAIMKALEQKKQEAEALGDNKQKESIQKVINDQKQKNQKDNKGDKGKSGSTIKYVINNGNNKVERQEIKETVPFKKIFDQAGKNNKKSKPENVEVLKEKNDDKNKSVNDKDDINKKTVSKMNESQDDKKLEKRKYILIKIDEEERGL